MEKDMRNKYINEIHKEINRCYDVKLLELIYLLLKKLNETEKRPPKKWLI